MLRVAATVALCVSIGSDLSSLCCLVGFGATTYYFDCDLVVTGLHTTVCVTPRLLPAQLYIPFKAKASPHEGVPALVDLRKALIGFGAMADP